MVPLNTTMDIPQAPDPELVKILGLPSYSTSRAVDLRLAQIELESVRRQKNLPELRKLTSDLEKQNERLLQTKENIESDLKGKRNVKLAMLNNAREAEFYRNKLFYINKLDGRLVEAAQKSQEILAKRSKLDKLTKLLKEFSEFEPTNDALQAKIIELKKSRLSLDMSFADENQ